MTTDTGLEETLAQEGDSMFETGRQKTERARSLGVYQSWHQAEVKLRKLRRTRKTLRADLAAANRRMTADARDIWLRLCYVEGQLVGHSVHVVRTLPGHITPEPERVTLYSLRAEREPSDAYAGWRYSTTPVIAGPLRPDGKRQTYTIDRESQREQASYLVDDARLYPTPEACLAALVERTRTQFSEAEETLQAAERALARIRAEEAANDN